MENVNCTKCGANNRPNSKYCSRCGYELSKFNTPNKETITIKKFDFEYVKPLSLILLLGALFGVMIALFITAIFLSDLIGIIPSILIAMAVPTAIFILYKKKIKSTGTATIGENHIELSIDNQNKKFEFDNIASYQVEYYNSVKLFLKLRDKTKFGISAPDSFCNSKELEQVTDYFETAIENYNETATKNKVVRTKSILERKGFFYSFVFITLAALGAICYAYYLGKNVPGTIFTALGVIFFWWAAYFKLRKKRKNKQTFANKQANKSGVE